MIERAGGRTTSLTPEGLQQGHTLGSVLSAGELEEMLGTNVLIAFRCLLIERFEANLRNLLSHGLADRASVYSPAASHLCCWFCTSARCRYSCVHNRKWKLEKNPRFARKGG